MYVGITYCLKQITLKVTTLIGEYLKGKADAREQLVNDCPCGDLRSLRLQDYTFDPF